MPPVSEKQRRFMQAAAHNKFFAKKAGIKPSVAKEFADSDPGGKLPMRAKKSRSEKWYAPKPGGA